MKIRAIVQARMSSSRLPGKVMRLILGKPLIVLLLERLARSALLDDIVVATSLEKEDEVIVDCCRRLGIGTYQGDLCNVLDRYYHAAVGSDVVVRITGDCPLLDPLLIDDMLRFFLAKNYDYLSNTLTPTYPDGLDIEIFTYRALEKAWQHATLFHDLEHVTPYIYNHSAAFHLSSYEGEMNLSHFRWTVDEPCDLEVITDIYQALYPNNPLFSTHDILAFLACHPEVARKNAHIQRNEGTWQTMIKDSAHDLSQRYEKSNALLQETLEIIPLASQTFSKSITQFPYKSAPLFIEKGQGSHVWDVDGNEYIDFINGLMAVLLGYNDPDVNAAIAAQLQQGISFSLPHRLEREVARKITQLIPAAEKVRFGKNGSDVTAAAIRLARAYTEREHVAVCGYHGWQDWYIGSTTRNKGVPQCVKELTHTFQYNHIDSLDAIFKQYPSQVAAVIMEPMNVEFPKDNFLQQVKALAHHNGALFILDEIITGCRFHLGGAQAVFNVTADLVTLGKGLGNGMPISVIAGRADIMSLMEDIFYSFTFGGETLSLAAANAVLDKLVREPVITTLIQQGKTLKEGVEALIDFYGMHDILSISGFPVWTFLNFKSCENYNSSEIKTFYMQEVMRRGILSFGTHNICYAHSDQDIQRLLSVYDEVFPLMKQAIFSKKLTAYLHCKPLQPLFTVR